MRFSILLPVILPVIAALTACGYNPTVSAAAREQARSVDCEQATCVDFIYVHGAATHSEADRQYIMGRVETLHAEVSAALYDTPEFVAGALEDGRYAIAPEPRLYFWGGNIDLVRDLDIIEDMLESQVEREGRGPNKFFARTHRRMAEAIYDVVWVSNPAHRYVLTDSLHALLRESRGRGRKVVLLGYSAGALVITNYAIHRIKGIHLDEFSRVIRGSNVLPGMFAGRDEWTCGEALIASGLVEENKQGLFQATLENATAPDDADLVAFREAYWQSRLNALPDLTRRHCLPDDTLMGGIGFGSMANLLTSKTDDAEGEMLVLVARHLLRGGQFWLNVNHADDLVGFNVYQDVSVASRMERSLGLEPIEGPGFGRSAEPEFRGANLVSGHTWYIKKPRQFAALVADTYARGFREKQAQQDGRSDNAADGAGFVQ